MITYLAFFPEEIMRFAWGLLACMVIVVACGLLWIVGGFVVGWVEEACMGRRGPDRRGKR